jgi:hypothetical protein
VTVKFIAKACKSPGCKEAFQVDEERICHQRNSHPSMEESAEESGEESENSRGVQGFIHSENFTSREEPQILSTSSRRPIRKSCFWLQW